MEIWPSHWAAPCKLQSLLDFWFSHILRWISENLKEEDSKRWGAQRSSQFPHKIFPPQLQLKNRKLYFYFDFLKKSICAVKKWKWKMISKWKMGTFNLEEIGKHTSTSGMLHLELKQSINYFFFPKQCFFTGRQQLKWHAFPYQYFYGFMFRN